VASDFFFLKKKNKKASKGSFSLPLLIPPYPSLGRSPAKQKEK